MSEKIQMKKEYTMPMPNAAALHAQAKASRAYVRQRRAQLGLSLISEGDLPKLTSPADIEEALSKIKGVSLN